MLLPNSLSALPCFNHIEKVTPIAGGLSHDCFKVAADNTYYFAKKITGEHLQIEVFLASIAAKENLSPTVYYSNEQWIICDYIEGDNLELLDIPLNDKITMSITLMVKFHQLNLSPSDKMNLAESNCLPIITNLNITNTINALFHPNNSPALISTITEIGTGISTEIETLINQEIDKSNLVCCHSDINFSNVLADGNEKTWLIDFEYACLAPVEFDLAMLITVNNIPNGMINTAINFYEQQVDRKVNRKLLKHYELFCLLINGLWYFNRVLDSEINLQENTQAKMLALATKQWQAFDLLYNQLNMPQYTKALQKFI